MAISGIKCARIWFPSRLLTATATCLCQIPKTFSWPVGWIGIGVEGRMANYLKNGSGSWMRLGLPGPLARVL